MRRNETLIMVSVEYYSRNFAALTSKNENK